MRAFALILALIFLAGLGACIYGLTQFMPLPDKIEKTYSLEWLPADAPKTADHFLIFTDEGIIKYYYVDEEASQVSTLTHPLEIERAREYNVNSISVIDGFLLVVFTLGLGFIFSIVLLTIVAVVCVLFSLFFLFEFFFGQH